MILQLKNKKKDKKKNITDDPFLNNNNKAKNYLFKYNELRNSLLKKDTNQSNDLLKKNSIYERRDSESSKINNFQQQSEFLAEKITIENELNAKIKEIKKQKKILNEEYNSLNKEIKFCHNIYKKAKSKLEQRIKTLSVYYYQILKKGVDVRHTGLIWVVIKLLELGAFIDKHHFPTFLNDEQICYLMKKMVLQNL